MCNIAPVMITVDRRPSYLQHTLHNMLRSSSSHSISIQISVNPVCANLNVSNALMLGSERAPWVLFLEDDIDVCDDFFGSVSRWLSDHATDMYRLYPLGAAYTWVDTAVSNGQSSVPYPVDEFYGTQSFVIRAHDAVSLAQYLQDHCYDRADDGTSYDLLIADWHKQQYPNLSHLLTPAPSFIQHIGMLSVIRPRPTVHTFESWPGREWSYKRECNS